MTTEAGESSTKIPVLPKSYIVIRLSPTIKPEAIQWLVSKIVGEKTHGGAELLVQCQPFHMRAGEVLILI